jgi:putative colanic acid biosynthesis UDP-glucose lipid carrier transferase
VLLAPLLTLIALAIRLETPGPVLFRQRRHGLGLKVFEIVKFRTLQADCSDPGGLRPPIRDGLESSPTRVGRFLRRTRLDEAPQLFNVVLGTMALVGPRPHPIGFLDTFGGIVTGYAERHAVLPGITGWAQIHGCIGDIRCRQDIERRVAYDLDYVRRADWRMDLAILLRTPLAVIRGSKGHSPSRNPAATRRSGARAGSRLGREVRLAVGEADR